MILFSPEAVSDIERVREFLDNKNPEAAKRALRVIFAGLEKARDFPDLGRPAGRGRGDPSNRSALWRCRLYRALRNLARQRRSSGLAALAWPRGADLSGTIAIFFGWPALTIILARLIFHFIPSRLRGAFDQRRQTRGGARWPFGALEIRRKHPKGGPSRFVPARQPRVAGPHWRWQPARSEVLGTIWARSGG